MSSHMEKRRRRQRRNKILRLASDGYITPHEIKNHFARPLHRKVDEALSDLRQEGILEVEKVGWHAKKYRLAPKIQKRARRRKLTRKVARQVARSLFEKATSRARIRERQTALSERHQTTDAHTTRCGLEPAGQRSSRDSEGRTTVTVATEQEARDGLVLNLSGLDVSGYRKNPVVLWSHGRDERRGDEPIGRAYNLRKEGGKLRAEVEWAGDDFAQRIRRKVETGFLNAASIGWDPREINKRATPPEVVRSEMLEFSIVAVPADTGALVDERDPAYA